MKLYLFSLLLFISTISYSQFALIDDKDGFANIRSSAGNSNNIVDTLKNGHIVWCFEPEGNWIIINYLKKEKLRTGYVYNNRIKHLSSFGFIPLYKYENQEAIFKKDSLTITITEGAFVVKNNLLKYKVTDNVKYLSTINGKSFWGTDGNIPNKQYNTIKIRIGKKIFFLPAAAIENLFEPNLNLSECYYDRDKDIIYISAINSDGAGSYVALWLIEKGKYKNKIVMIPF